jgi:hypothetical protein
LFLKVKKREFFVKIVNLGSGPLTRLAVEHTGFPIRTGLAGVTFMALKLFRKLPTLSKAKDHLWFSNWFPQLSSAKFFPASSSCKSFTGAILSTRSPNEAIVWSLLGSGPGSNRLSPFLPCGDAVNLVVSTSGSVSPSTPPLPYLIIKGAYFRPAPPGQSVYRQT